MIDKAARTQLAESLRHLAAGVISNDEFEKRRPRKSQDVAVRQVFSEGAWFLYDDLREHRLIGKDKLSDSARTDLARWIVFLKTDLAYEWPVVPISVRLALLPLNLATLGLVGKLVQRWSARSGDSTVWPFLRRADYEVALRQPPYLRSPVYQRLHPTAAEW